MRKSDPTLVRQEFADMMNSLVSHFDRLATALVGSQHEMADLSLLAENIFLSAYVSFEGFVSNLFLAYANRDPTDFANFLSE